MTKGRCPVRVRVVVAALLCAAAGCSGDGGDGVGVAERAPKPAVGVDRAGGGPTAAASGAGAVRADTPAGSAAPAAPRPVVLTLVKPGVPPLRALTFGLRAPVTLDLEASVETDSTISTAGLAMRAEPIPGMTASVRATVTPGEGAFRGGASVLLEVVGITADQGPGRSEDTEEALRKELDASKGRRFRVNVTANGEIDGVASLGAAGTPDGRVGLAMMLVSQVLTATLMLPAEPVGVGGEWRMTVARDVPGGRMERRGNFRLAALDAERATVEFSLFDDNRSDRVTVPDATGREAKSRYTSELGGTFDWRVGAWPPAAAFTMKRTTVYTPKAGDHDWTSDERVTVRWGEVDRAVR